MYFGFIIFAEWGHIQDEITSYVDHPSCFHCGKMDFKSLCTGTAILPPSPIIRFFYDGQLFWVLILPEGGASQLRFISHLGQRSCFHCGKIEFQNYVLTLLFCLLPP